MLYNMQSKTFTMIAAIFLVPSLNAEAQEL